MTAEIIRRGPNVRVALGSFIPVWLRGGPIHGSPHSVRDHLRRRFDAGFSCVAAWVGKRISESPHLVRGNSRPQEDPKLSEPRAIVAEVASYRAMTDAFERLKTALADRYAIQEELGGAAWPRSTSPRTSSTTAKSR